MKTAERAGSLTYNWGMVVALRYVYVLALVYFLLLGATRSGKSTLGNFMRAMWMQYRNAQAKVFDVDGHARLVGASGPRQLFL